MTSPLNATLIGTVKDEGPYLLEWICYYKLIGFNRIVIASNDCSDATDDMLAYLHNVGEITHIENSVQPAGTRADPQNRAYQRAWAFASVAESDWVLVADADEFLNIHAGDGTLPDLLSAIAALPKGAADVISAPWRVFGNAGVAAFEDAPVIGQFNRAAAPGMHRIQRYTAFKTLFRPKFAGRLSIHRPRLRPRFRDGVRPCNWVNGAGAPMPDRYLTQGWRFFEDSYGDTLVTMNHYMIKSSEAFLMKRYRGTANSADKDRIGFDYFDTFNANHVEETSIMRHLPALSKAVAALTAAHPTLFDLHRQSLAFHRQKLAEAKAAIIRDHPDMAARMGISAG